MEMESRYNARPGRTGLLFLGRTRPGFDPEWGKLMRGRIRTFLDSHSPDTVVPFDNIADERTLREAISVCRNAGVDTLVVTQPTISDGRLAPVLAQQWAKPLVLWATPEKSTGEMISSNSLVGTHVFASTLRQLGRDFELLTGDPLADDFASVFDQAVRLVRTVGRLRLAKVGLVGYHAPGFIDLQVDAADLSRRLGPELLHLGMVEFLARVDEIDEARVSEDIRAARDLGLPLRGVDEDVLPLQSRFYLAVRDLMETENLAALGMRCWPELPDRVGAWPYVAVSRLVSEGVPVVTEGDVDGAISVLIAQELGNGPVYVSDWLEHDRKHVTIWHTGSPPLQLCDPVGRKTGPTIAVHFNNRKPAVVEATIRSGIEATAFRLWRCDGAYHLAGFEGTTAEPTRHLLGVNGALESSKVDIEEWFDSAVHEGMPHHICIAPGRCVQSLKRFARLSGVRWHE